MVSCLFNCFNDYCKYDNDNNYIRKGNIKIDYCEVQEIESIKKVEERYLKCTSNK